MEDKNYKLDLSKITGGELESPQAPIKTKFTLRCERPKCSNSINEQYHFDFVEDGHPHLYCTLLCLMEAIKYNTDKKLFELKQRWPINE